MFYFTFQYDFNGLYGGSLQDREYEIMHRLENRHWWFSAKKRFVTVFLDEYFTPRGGRILDIGCGTGGMTEVLGGYGQVVGLDRHPAACALYSRRHPLALVQGEARRLPFKKNSFHLITLLDVLYHRFIHNDEEVLTQVQELLCPGGFLLITDSAFEFLRSAHDQAVMARHRYTLKELKGKLIRCGFSLVRGSYLYCTVFPFVVLARLWGKRRLFRPPEGIRSDLKETAPWLNRLLIRILAKEGSLLRRRDLPFGSSIILLGRKE